MRQHIRKVAAQVIVIAVAGVLAACGSEPSVETDEQGLKKISVRTDVYFTGAVLPLVAGVEAGIFEKHGLNVSLEEGKGSATTIQTVGNGSDDIGYVDAGTLVQSVAQGVEVKMVAGMVQESPLALYAFKESGITTPKDLEGKTAGYTPGSAAEQIFPAYAKSAGIDADSVTFRNVDIPTRTELFVSGKTDFTFGLLNVSGANIAAACDCEPVALPYSDQDIKMLSSGIVTRNEFLEQNTEAVEAFLAGLVDSVEYVNGNQEKALDHFFAYAANSKVDRKVIAEQWKASMELSATQDTQGQPFGCMSAEDWKSTVSLMEQHGDVAPGSVDVRDVASNSQLPGDCADDLGNS